MAKVKKVHESFEDVSDNGKFSKVCRGMEQSKAWQTLTLQQTGLYLLLKGKFTKYKTGDKKDNRDDISFPKSEWVQYYKTQQMFAKDIDALIDAGLIRVVKYQGNLRKPTIYGFSDKWKQFGTKGFKIEERDKRPTNTHSAEHLENLSRSATERNLARHKAKRAALKSRD
jgi:hypothetical protein